MTNLSSHRDLLVDPVVRALCFNLALRLTEFFGEPSLTTTCPLSMTSVTVPTNILCVGKVEGLYSTSIFEAVILYFVR